MLAHCTATAPAPSGPRPSARRGAATDVRLVAAAEEFLRVHVARPIYTDELCAALGVSPRKLHQIFVAASGMSPQAYLKARRLVLVRRALLSGGAEAPLVKSVALAHGFWHLGRFAREYRERFGELPSETLARVLLGLDERCRSAGVPPRPIAPSLRPRAPSARDRALVQGPPPRASLREQRPGRAPAQGAQEATSTTRRMSPGIACTISRPTADARGRPSHGSRQCSCQRTG